MSSMRRSTAHSVGVTRSASRLRGDDKKYAHQYHSYSSVDADGDDTAAAPSAGAGTAAESKYSTPGAGRGGSRAASLLTMDNANAEEKAATAAAEERNAQAAAQALKTRTPSTSALHGKPPVASLKERLHHGAVGSIIPPSTPAPPPSGGKEDDHDVPYSRFAPTTPYSSTGPLPPVTPYGGRPGMSLSSMPIEAPVAVELHNNEVIVFGFASHNATAIINKFQSYGEVMRGAEGGNWVTLRYRRRLDAERALTLNGKIFDGETMIGVLPVTPRLADELADFGAAKAIAGGSVLSSTGPTGSSGAATGANGWSTSASEGLRPLGAAAAYDARPAVGSSAHFRPERNIYVTKDSTFLTRFPDWFRAVVLACLQHLFNW